MVTLNRSIEQASIRTAVEQTISYLINEVEQQSQTQQSIKQTLDIILDHVESQSSIVHMHDDGPGYPDTPAKSRKRGLIDYNKTSSRRKLALTWIHS